MIHKTVNKIIVGIFVCFLSFLMLGCVSSDYKGLVPGKDVKIGKIEIVRNSPWSGTTKITITDVNTVVSTTEESEEEKNE